ncbi:glycosyltransferase [Flagellimonas lutimaris]|uniref:Glycosyltransferase n=1 Tax=Flagellimonas lutimaris TaxID=475082 RepID=A0A3A1N3B7_9FLAO|nr:glycosyltransferase family 4 protein [Allomuricauda lutimaris]RIV30528.1 glycosyltransferase [Allomuricauda lutimaris]
MSNKTILHLNSYYIDNHLYSQLYSKLDAFINQKVYIPIKLNRKPENIVDLDNTKLFFDKQIKPFHKYNYFGKINFLYKRLINQGLHTNIDFVHAHNLFTDGALAYKINKSFKVPYIVTVRLTDITLQYKYMYHRRASINKVLKNAERIIFISPIYRNRLFSMMPKKLVKKLAKKTLIIPNGINDIWLNNPFPERSNAQRKMVNLIYVGQIMKLKNIKELIAAIDLLNNKGESIKYNLNVVGGQNHNEPEYFQEFLKLVDSYDWLEYKGKIKDASKLMELYRNADVFTMPSKPELFGLVYIEALSQGLPIIYSKGEGIDGFFEELPVGQSVDPKNIESIAEGIEQVASTNYKGLNKAILPFDWNNLIKEYLKFYHQDE